MDTRRTLVLHVGLPKTGTSALQSWCHRDRERLLRSGVHYPDVVFDALRPRHHFLASGLHHGDLDALATMLAADRSRCLVLSTESLSHDLYDFSAGALAGFRELTSHLDVVVFLVSREPDAWTRSYHKQCIVTPSASPESLARPGLRFEESASLPRVRRLIDLPTLTRDLAMAFGAREVKVAPYEGAWMAEFRRLLGVPETGALDDLGRVHVSISDDLAELIRQLNGIALRAADRQAFLAAFQRCFRTQHNALIFAAHSMPEPDPRNTAIVARLIPGTPAQATLIERLTGWLEAEAALHRPAAEAGRSRLATGSPS